MVSLSVSEGSEESNAIPRLIFGKLLDEQGNIFGSDVWEVCRGWSVIPLYPDPPGFR